MTLPKVAILFLTFATDKREVEIPRAMRGFEQMTYPKDRVELICIESRSKLGVVKEWFEKDWMPKSGNSLPRITYIYNDEQIGFAGNNNLGYQKAKELGCDYVYLQNEDAVCDPDFLTHAVARAEQDANVAYVQSLLILGEEPNKINTVGNAFHYLGFGYCKGYLWTREQAASYFVEERKRNPDLEIGYWSGAGVLGKISAIDACGGLFDEKIFLYHEDTDAAFQARVRGYKIVIEPKSIVYHYYEFSKSITKYYWMERNRFMLIFSYYRWWTLFLIAPMLLAMEIGQFGFALVRGWWREKLKVYKEITSRDFRAWIRVRRKKIQAARVIGDREFLKWSVSTIEFQGDAVKNPVLEYVGNPVMRAYGWVVKRLAI